MEKENLLNNLRTSAVEAATKEVQAEHQKMLEAEATPVAVEAVESDKTTAKVDGQAIVEKEAPAIPAKEATEKPEYDYKKGYDGLRSCNTKLAQKVADLEKSLDDVRAVKRQPEAPQYSREQLNEWAQSDPVAFGAWVAEQKANEKTSGLKQEIEALKGGFGAIYAANTVNKFRQQYSDFQALEEDIREEIMSLPEELQTNPRYYETVLDSSYWKAKGKKSGQEISRAREEGKQEAQGRAKEKQEAFVEGSGGKSPEQPTDTSKMSSKEIYKVLEARGLVRE